MKLVMTRLDVQMCLHIFILSMMLYGAGFLPDSVVKGSDRYCKVR